MAFDENNGYGMRAMRTSCATNYSIITNNLLVTFTHNKQLAMHNEVHHMIDVDSDDCMVHIMHCSSHIARTVSHFIWNYTAVPQ